MSGPLHHDKEIGARGDSARLDPVCGMTVSPGSPHAAEYSGCVYAFCSAGCRTKFLTLKMDYMKSATTQIR